jgi:hypothetical protein
MNGINYHVSRLSPHFTPGRRIRSSREMVDLALVILNDVSRTDMMSAAPGMAVSQGTSCPGYVTVSSAGFLAAFFRLGGDLASGSPNR